MTARPRLRKLTSSLGWQVADDPEWEFAGSSHMPLYAGSHHGDRSRDTQPLISLSTSLADKSGGGAGAGAEYSPKKSADIQAPGLRSHFFRDLRGDYGNIALLIFLYILQGVPLGLTASIPLVLQNRHVSYAQQAIFSFAYWPFSLKLLWAPIVDACYWSKLGRRKSWLVPTQYLIGLFMFALSNYVSSVLGDHGTGSGPSGQSATSSGAGPNVLYITTIFFSFNFLAATQDIAVDGWALTMLSKKNVGYASTCNAVGQTAGYFLGNVVFLALESSEFCNKYLRSVPKETGIVTLADFCYYWSWIFIICTTLVLIFKREIDNNNSNNSSTSDYTNDNRKNSDFNSSDDLNLKDTYKTLWEIIRLKPVITLICIHLTAKFAFAAADGITGLKLIEFGVPKDKLAFIAVPLVPLQILLPIIIGKYTAGPRPLDVYIKAYPYRILMGLFFAGLVYITPNFKQSDGHFAFSFYAIIIIAYLFHQITVYSIFVAVMAFHAQISDPLVGGTYMTLMNTVTNLGGNWPVTFALSIVDRLTWKECVVGGDPGFPGSPNGGLPGAPNPAVTMATACLDEAKCRAAGGQCQISLDGYYLLSALCAVVGFLWWRLMRRKMNRLQLIDKSLWTLKRNN